MNVDWISLDATVYYLVASWVALPSWPPPVGPSPSTFIKPAQKESLPAASWAAPLGLCLLGVGVGGSVP